MENNWNVLVEDDNCHKYVIPYVYQRQWDEWVDSGEDEPPTWAESVEKFAFKEWKRF